MKKIVSLGAGLLAAVTVGVAVGELHSNAHDIQEVRCAGNGAVLGRHWEECGNLADHCGNLGDCWEWCGQGNCKWVDNFVVSAAAGGEAAVPAAAYGAPEVYVPEEPNPAGYGSGSGYLCNGNCDPQNPCYGYCGSGNYGGGNCDPGNYGGGNGHHSGGHHGRGGHH